MFAATPPVAGIELNLSVPASEDAGKPEQTDLGADIAGYPVPMLLVTSIVIGALGAMARFQAAAEVAGFKMHALGVVLMLCAAIGVLVSLKPVRTHLVMRTLDPHAASG